MRTLIALCCLAFVAGPASAERGGGNRIGAGVHYWRTIDKIAEEDFDRDGLSWLVSYQYAFSLLKVEVGAEIFPNGYYGSEKVTVAPHALVGLATLVYGAVGVGTACSSGLDGAFSDPFYMIRAGLDLEILPGVRLDLNANYYFADWEDVTDVNTDTVTLGAQVRFAF